MQVAFTPTSVAPPLAFITNGEPTDTSPQIGAIALDQTTGKLWQRTANGWEVSNSQHEFFTVRSGGDAPTTGSGGEHYVSGGGYYIQAYNRDGAVYLPLFLLGTEVNVGTTGQKVGFLGATPVVRPVGATQAAVTASTDFTGADTVSKATVLAAVQAVETLVNKIRTDLVALGLIKGAA